MRISRAALEKAILRAIPVSGDDGCCVVGTDANRDATGYEYFTPIWGPPERVAAMVANQVERLLRDVGCGDVITYTEGSSYGG